MEKQKCIIWNNNYNLDIVYDCYEGEEILQNQKLALQKFLDDITSISNETVILGYCKENNIPINVSLQNTFTPNCIYVSRTTKERKVSLLCDTIFDYEHGAAIVFENEKLAEIGPVDLVV